MIGAIEIAELFDAEERILREFVKEVKKVFPDSHIEFEYSDELDGYVIFQDAFMSVNNKHVMSVFGQKGRTILEKNGISNYHFSRNLSRLRELSQKQKYIRKVQDNKSWCFDSVLNDAENISILFKNTINIIDTIEIEEEANEINNKIGMKNSYEFLKAGELDECGNYAI